MKASDPENEEEKNDRPGRWSKFLNDVPFVPAVVVKGVLVLVLFSFLVYLLDLYYMAQKSSDGSDASVTKQEEKKEGGTDSTAPSRSGKRRE